MEWISVDDALPGTIDDVLVSVFIGTKHSFHQEIVMGFYDDGWLIQQNNGWVFIEDTIFRVTHWQLLPKLPEITPHDLEE